MSINTYYDLLEIPQNATIEQIRKAYRKKAKQYHPDTSGQSNAHMHFLILRQAYEILIDANKRHLYDMAMISNSEHLLTYGQWKEIERRKIEELEEKAFQDFLKRKEAFQQSKYFKPAKALLLLAPFVFYLFGIGILFSCLWLMWTYHLMFFFIFLPFICLAVFLLLATPKWLREAKRYF
ncbi:J domain-containing protein [Cytophaga aurantiaca]|uniref:J domain-containing protein n=1 Tax=Cytophaga aurantiaca TaxID=29530 RepID=UPI0003A2C1BA|nr:J domain-containing protein [Cytophaga aurantiaca]